MKINIFKQLKTSYHNLIKEVKDPKKNAKRQRKFKELSLVIVRGILLGGLCFVILFPTLQQILMALRAPADVNNPSVIWIPEHWSLMNLKISVIVLDYWRALFNTFKVSSISMLLQLASTALAGYAFSRLRFKGSNILFFLVILTIIIPPQALSLSQFLYFRELGLIGKEGSIYLMSGLGMGIRSGIFIYIFRSFFRGLPQE